MSEEGGEGCGRDVLGGEPENLADLSACIEFGVLSNLSIVLALDVISGEGKWVPMDHLKGKKHEGVGVILASKQPTHCIEDQK